MLYVRRLCLTLVCVGVVAVPAQADPIKYLPSDTEMVFTFNLRNLLNSELAKDNKELVAQLKTMLEAAIKNNDEAQKFADELGFDLFTDLDGITVGAPANAAGNPEKNVVIIEGKFNQAKFKAVGQKAAKQFGEVLTISSIGGQTVYVVTPPGENKTGYIALLNKSTMVMTGSKDLITDVIGRETGKKGALKKNVSALLETMDAKQTIGFLATNNYLSKAAEASNNPQAAAAGQVLMNLDGVSGGLTVSKNLQFQVGVATKDEKTAKEYVDQGNAVLPFVKGMAAKKAKDDERFAPAVEVLKTITVAAQGQTIVVRGHVAPEIIANAIKMLPLPK